MAHYPDASLTIAALANSGALYDPESIEMGVARVILGLPEPELSETEMDEEDVRRFSGVYDARSVWFRLAADGDGRRLRLTMQGPAEDSWEYVQLAMARVGEREFVARDSPDAVRLKFADGMPPDQPTSVWVDIVGIRWYGVRR